MLLARKYSERGYQTIGTATEVIASIPTRMTPVLPDKSGATVLKSALQRVIEFNKKWWSGIYPLAYEVNFIKVGGMTANDQLKSVG